MMKVSYYFFFVIIVWGCHSPDRNQVIVKLKCTNANKLLVSLKNSSNERIFIDESNPLFMDIHILKVDSNSIDCFPFWLSNLLVNVDSRDNTRCECPRMNIDSLMQSRVIQGLLRKKLPKDYSLRDSLSKIDELEMRLNSMIFLAPGDSSVCMMDIGSLSQGNYKVFYSYYYEQNLLTNVDEDFLGYKKHKNNILSDTIIVRI